MVCMECVVLLGMTVNEGISLLALVEPHVQTTAATVSYYCSRQAARTEVAELCCLIPQNVECGKGLNQCRS